MCGRYSLFVTPDELEERFGVSVPADYGPRYNAAPRQDLPVIRADSDAELTRANWGFLPSWTDDPEDAPRPINARSETVRDKPMFRDAFASAGAGADLATAGRCLVPADGFYEWKQEGGGKQPYRVTLADEKPFAMAGLYAVWEGVEKQTGLDAFAGGGKAEPETRRVVSFTVCTTEPNDLVADLHHRMAVMVPEGEEETWLHGGVEEAAGLFEPYPAGEMRAYPVSTAVNDPANDSPAVVEELGAN
ncbi:SOS response-associated peptidase [Haloarchaeobius sp. TZWSO28]|uniref:SOS response-associated peptidase n=1 Tax=Haloarchaeobius sp. TZWSO28 TaxID=3446119 RepID=UPI003EBD6C5D